VAKLEQIWCEVRRTEVFSISSESALGLLRHPANIVDPAPLRRRIDDNLPYSRLEEASIPLHVTATDVRGAATLLS
jgi:NTE family protein